MTNSLGIKKSAKDTNIVVAMSGGVDSSVVAGLMKQEGYNVTGITLKLYDDTKPSSKGRQCCAGRDIIDAKRVSEALSIEHKILYYQKKFKNEVIDSFINSYVAGETPIPCVQCNQTVKFRDLFKFAKNLKADALVTGHYVRRQIKNGKIKLLKGIDLKKDQSYFLFATLKEQLDYLRFPIGGYLKSEIRNLAIQYNLDISDKPDSQDICFVSSKSYRDLINKLNPEINTKGDILNTDNKVIGKHNGIANYTIGQRKGVGIGGNSEPLYVIKIDKKNNFIILGKEENLKKNRIRFNKINWLDDSIHPKNLNCKAKIRSTQNEISGLLNINNNIGEFEFKSFLNTTAPGQACVLYKDEQVLGGGWITN